jgi:hypothetical protein
MVPGAIIYPGQRKSGTYQIDVCSRLTCPGMANRQDQDAKPLTIIQAE